MWEVDHKEGGVLKSWCFWTVMLEKTLESPLDSKEIKPVNSKGNQPRMFIGRTDAEAEVPILWPPDAKSWLIGKDPDAGKDWSQEEKGTTEDETDGISDSMDMSLSKLREMVKHWEAWRAAVHGVTMNGARLNDRTRTTKTCFSSSMEHNTPPSPASTPLKGCWRSAAAREAEGKCPCCYCSVAGKGSGQVSTGSWPSGLLYEDNSASKHCSDHSSWFGSHSTIWQESIHRDRCTELPRAFSSLWFSQIHTASIFQGANPHGKFRCFCICFPGGSKDKEFTYNAGHMGSTPGLGRSPGEGSGTPLQYSCLENPLDRGAWRDPVYGVAEIGTGLSD